jgi:molecular chaperone Hsp33
MEYHDHLQRLNFNALPVRGELVSVQTAWQHIVSLHQYPPAVQNLLGEMLAASALLSSTLKFEGSLIMQLHGDGPVRLLVCECHSDLGVRATAKLAPDAAIANDATLTELVNPRGQARMAITLDPSEKLPGQKPYQGIVPLEGKTIAEMLEGYMSRSEQIESHLWLASNDDTCAGMLIQRLPQKGGSLKPPSESDEPWSRIVHLCSTLQKTELLSLAPGEIATRLFWQEGASLGAARTVKFRCTCSRERVADMLRRLGRTEVEGVIAEFEQVGVHCEFCNTHYVFDSVDAAQLFHSESAPPAVQGTAKH